MQARAGFGPAYHIYYTCAAHSLVLLQSDLLAVPAGWDADFILDPGFLPHPNSPVAAHY